MLATFFCNESDSKMVTICLLKSDQKSFCIQKPNFVSSTFPFYLFAFESKQKEVKPKKNKKLPVIFVLVLIIFQVGSRTFVGGNSTIFP